jgi:hypothetical protein
MNRHAVVGTYSGEIFFDCIWMPQTIRSYPRRVNGHKHGRVPTPASCLRFFVLISPRGSAVERTRQAAQLLALGVRLDAEGFVVAQPEAALCPDSISKESRLRIVKSGLPRIRFHDLRHTKPRTCSAPAFIRRSPRSGLAIPASALH